LDDDDDDVTCPSGAMTSQASSSAGMMPLRVSSLCTIIVILFECASAKHLHHGHLDHQQHHKRHVVRKRQVALLSDFYPERPLRTTNHTLVGFNDPGEADLLHSRRLMHPDQARHMIINDVGGAGRELFRREQREQVPASMGQSFNMASQIRSSLELDEDQEPTTLVPATTPPPSTTGPSATADPSGTTSAIAGDPASVTTPVPTATTAPVAAVPAAQQSSLPVALIVGLGVGIMGCGVLSIYMAIQTKDSGSRPISEGGRNGQRASLLRDKDASKGARGVGSADKYKAKSAASKSQDSAAESTPTRSRSPAPPEAARATSASPVKNEGGSSAYAQLRNAKKQPAAAAEAAPAAPAAPAPAPVAEAPAGGAVANDDIMDF